MQIFRDFDLTEFNTLSIYARAKIFIEIKDEQDLRQLFTLKEFEEAKKIFLGGGSNILFTKDFDGTVILNKIKGIEILTPTKIGVPTEVGKDDVYIRVMSGEVWHDLVRFTTERGYWGIENLALIPGTVGGAPVQNIGAYGAELKDALINVEAYSVLDGSKRIFLNEECKFGYRDSIFKSELKGQYFIGAITLRLSNVPKPNISYKILADYLKEHNIKITSSKDVSDAVSYIRQSKLPDPKVIANAGSFFKNIFVSEERLNELLKTFPDIKYFKESGEIKIPSAWLIERAGWKGKRVGNVGVHEKHALVLVNYGGGTGKEIENLATEIIDSVFTKFGLKLTPEVNFI